VYHFACAYILAQFAIILSESIEMVRNVTHPIGNSLSRQFWKFIDKYRHLVYRRLWYQSVSRLLNCLRFFFIFSLQLHVNHWEHFACKDILGDDVMWMVFSHLDYKDLVECEKVCASWKRILDEKKGYVRKWREMLMKRVSDLGYFAQKLGVTFKI
jgi:F-box domain